MVSSPRPSDPLFSIYAQISCRNGAQVHQKWYYLDFDTIEFRTKKSLYMHLYRGLERLICFKQYNIHKWECRHFWDEGCQNYGLYQTIEIKVFENLISYKKVSRRTCISPPGVELGGSKNRYVLKICTELGK